MSYPTICQKDLSVDPAVWLDVGAPALVPQASNVGICSAWAVLQASTAQ